MDNRPYYKRCPKIPRATWTWPAPGTVSTLAPQALKLVMDSLRYWVPEMHVDGFRFDLASTLARRWGTLPAGRLLPTLHQDPISPG